MIHEQSSKTIFQLAGIFSKPLHTARTASKDAASKTPNLLITNMLYQFGRTIANPFNSITETCFLFLFQKRKIFQPIEYV